MLGNPEAVTISQILKVTPSNSFAKWLEERGNYKKFAYRLETCGYMGVRNEKATGGHNRWRYRVQRNGVIMIREVSVYALSKLPRPAQVLAAEELIQRL